MARIVMIWYPAFVLLFDYRCVAPFCILPLIQLVTFQYNEHVPAMRPVLRNPF